MFQYRWVNNALVSFVIANFLISIGKSDVISRYVEFLPRHYLDLVVTFLSVFIVFEYIDRTNSYLNGRISWTDHFLRRATYQLLWAVAVPVVLAIFLTYLMWQFIWDQDLVVDGYFRYEFLPQVLFILLVNLYLLVVYLFRGHRASSSAGGSERLIARRGSATVPIPYDDIAGLQLRDGVIRAITFSNEQFILSENMDHYERLLPTELFFRANRQHIVHKRACRSYAPAKNGKIEVGLLPALTSVVISQKRASSFRSWIKS